MFERTLARALQVGLFLLLVAAVAAGSLSVAVNAGLALGVTLVPAVLERDAGIHLDAGLTLFVTVAVTLHAVGMLGYYGAVWWWDHLTHTLSAMVVAGVSYTLIRAFDEHSPTFAVPPRRLPVLVFFITVGMGLLWEGLELGARVVTDLLGVEVIWVHYGPGDTALDLVFDAVGALLVAFLFLPRLQPAVESVRAWFDRRLPE